MDFLHGDGLDCDHFKFIINTEKMKGYIHSIVHGKKHKSDVGIQDIIARSLMAQFSAVHIFKIVRTSSTISYCGNEHYCVF